MKLLGTRFTT